MAISMRISGADPKFSYGLIPPVTSFVILDDDSDMDHLRHRLVRTTMVKGLTPEHADLAIAILNAPPTDLLMIACLPNAELN